MGILNKIFGDENTRAMKEYEPLVDKINLLEKETEALSDEGLCAKTEKFKKDLEGGKTLDDILPEAYAVVREASRRTLGQRHFDVQLFGGIAIHKGNIAEMRTGEGKTLVATLPVYLNALSGKGVHVVTVNDYLSRRDAVWMGQIYSFLGLSVGVLNSRTSYIYDFAHTEVDKERDVAGGFHVVHQFLRPAHRKEAYSTDITYGTNSEYGFDYLRDNIALSTEDLVQRGHHYAIVDEIDSILIDEARTPLIISGESGEAEEMYIKFAGIAESLKKDEDFEVDEKRKAVVIKESGMDKVEKALGVDNIYTELGVGLVHHLENAVRAKSIFNKD
ncbi:MAG: preprotein translocase subunit SecA, partial [Patescibacteria group bacterium]